MTIPYDAFTNSRARMSKKTPDRLIAPYGGTAIIAAFLLVVVGCDPRVDLFKENDLHYSIFGVLNPSADTQFIRVEPLRDSLLTEAPEAIDAEATLTNLDTDQTISLQDSLFRSPNRHNFYTTADLDSMASYRLVVEGPQDAESRVEISIPKPVSSLRATGLIPDCFPNCPRIGPPSCNGNESSESRTAFVSVEETDRLVSVRARYVMVMGDPEAVWSYGHLEDTTHTQQGTIRASIDYADDWCSIPGNPRHTPARIEVVVAAGSPSWPSFLTLDLETELLPGVASNVDGGVGFVGGVVTDTVRVFP